MYTTIHFGHHLYTSANASRLGDNSTFMSEGRGGETPDIEKMSTAGKKP
jgi:hypothetical protein